MKKIIAAIMIFNMLFAVSACTGSKAPDTQSEKNDDIKSSMVESEIAEPKPIPAESTSNIDVASLYASLGLSDYTAITGCPQIEVSEQTSTYIVDYKSDIIKTEEYENYMIGEGWTLYSDESDTYGTTKIYTKGDKHIIISHIQVLERTKIAFSKNI